MELIESKEDIRKVLETELGRDLPAIKSRMHYFFAQHHGQLKDYKKQRELLLEGYKNDPHDADVLIAMFRVSEADDRVETSYKQANQGSGHFLPQPVERDHGAVEYSQVF